MLRIRRRCIGSFKVCECDKQISGQSMVRIRRRYIASFKVSDCTHHTVLPIRFPELPEFPSVPMGFPSVPRGFPPVPRGLYVRGIPGSTGEYREYRGGGGGGFKNYHIRLLVIPYRTSTLLIPISTKTYIVSLLVYVYIFLTAKQLRA